MVPDLPPPSPFDLHNLLRSSIEPVNIPCQFHQHCSSHSQDNIPLQHKYGYIKDEKLGWRAIPTQWRKVSDILTLFNHPNRVRDREAHLNFYARTYNRGRQLSYCKTKLNHIWQKAFILNEKIHLYIQSCHVCPSVFRISEKRADRFPWNLSWSIGIIHRLEWKNIQKFSTING